MIKPHLVELPGEEREPEAVRRFLESPIAESFFRELGLPEQFTWCALRIQKKQISSSAEGDIDILAGPLAWEDPQRFQSFVEATRRRTPQLPPYICAVMAALNAATSGGIKWPPALNYVVAVEAKLAYFSINENNVKSQKAGAGSIRRIRGQLRDLLNLGFDRIGLLDIIANPPASGLNSQAWMNASSIAAHSQDAMNETLKVRLEHSSPAGHWVVSLGAVAGGDESECGVGGVDRIHEARANLNSQRPQDQTVRREMERKLAQILQSVRRPLSFPLVADLGAASLL